MKKVIIKKIALHYFKGVKSIEVDFNENETTIAGPNGCGKSTIADAFTWLLFGKNQVGESDTKFLIKTVDSEGVEIPHIDHEVSAIISVDGEDIELRRVLVPEYNKQDELKGNHTEYFFNGVPVKKIEFDAKVKSIIDESVFKLITSPTAFLNLEWRKQREMLMDIAGTINDEEIVAVNEDFREVYEEMKAKNISVDEMRRYLQNNLTRVNDQMDHVPARIDEIKRNMPDAQNYQQLEAERARIEAELKNLEKASVVDSSLVPTENAIAAIEREQATILEEAQKADRARIFEANKVHDQLQEELNEAMKKRNDFLASGKSELAEVERKVNERKAVANQVEIEIVNLRNDWKRKKEEEFKGGQVLICPIYNTRCEDVNACRRFDEESDKAFEAFKANKAEALKAISEKGKKLAEDLLNLKKDADMYLGKAEELKARNAKSDEEMSKAIEEITKKLDKHLRLPLISTVRGENLPKWMELQAKKESLVEKRNEAMAKVEGNRSILFDKSSELVEQIAAINTKLETKNTIAKLEERIAELEGQLKKLGAEKADIEYKKQMVDEFEVAKMNEVSNRVNGMFKMVTWQMFQRQVNGEIIPACVALVNGVRWSDANTAARINAGIDVAYTLATANDVSAPMFIDNAECSGFIYNPENLQRILLKFDITKSSLTIE